MSCPINFARMHYSHRYFSNVADAAMNHESISTGCCDLLCGSITWVRCYETNIA